MNEKTNEELARDILKLSDVSLSVPAYKRLKFLIESALIQANFATERKCEELEKILRDAEIKNPLNRSESLALKWMNKTLNLRNQLAAAEKQIAEMGEALKKNHEWHEFRETCDSFYGYSDSTLREANLKALSSRQPIT